MSSTVVMAPNITRSSLELMLDLIQKRDEQPKDVPPALPARPTSRGRLPSSRRSLPLSIRLGSIAPEPSSSKESLVAVAANLACDDKFRYELTVNNVRNKIVETEDWKNQSLQQIIGVQKCFRRVIARRQFEELKKGATTLQSFVRGERARCKSEVPMKRLRAAILIQKYVRGWIVRFRFVNQKDIIHLQSVVRGCLARKYFIVLKNMKMLKVNEANDKRHLETVTQEMKESNKDYLWIHHSVLEELQLRILKADASLQQKEEEHARFRQQLELYENKMKSMEEMWQEKMISLQGPSLNYPEVHQSVPSELQRWILNAETTLRQKEQENDALQKKLKQQEMRWSEYEGKMKSMEEMWQKQIASLQLNLASARKKLPAADFTNLPEKPVSSTICHSYDLEGTMSTEAQTPKFRVTKKTHASSTCVGGNQNVINLLVKEFAQRKQVFEDSVGFLIMAKSKQPDSGRKSDEELQKLKIQFTSWQKDYKDKLQDAKSILKKLGNARSEKKHKRWRFRGST